MKEPQTKASRIKLTAIFAVAEKFLSPSEDVSFSLKLAFKLNNIKLAETSSVAFPHRKQCISKMCFSFLAKVNLLSIFHFSFLPLSQYNYLKCSQNHLIYAFCLKINFLITKWLKFFFFHFAKEIGAPTQRGGICCGEG